MKHPLKRLIANRPFADMVLCHFLRRRMALPPLSLAALFDDFDEAAVTIRETPRGAYSTPFADVVMLLKLVVCAHSQRILEIGSFRGYTALLLAQHSSEDARIVTVDHFPEHGEAYRQTPFAAKIERRVGKMDTAMFTASDRAAYDLIFVDADHRDAGVKRDTELVLPLVAPHGYIVWHDYANWGYFNGENGVPECLADLAATGLPLAHVAGTALAIHSPAWATDAAARARYEGAIHRYKDLETNANPWTSASVRS